MSERFAHNTAYGLAAGVVSSLGRFATTVIIARMLGVHDTGLFNFVLWVVGLLGALIDLGVYAALVRYLPEVSRREGTPAAKDVAAYLLGPYSVIVCLSFLALCLVAVWMYVDPGQVRRLGVEPSPTLWTLVALFCAVQALGNFGIGYLQGMQRFHIVAVLALVSTAVQLIICVVGSLLFGVIGAVLGNLAAMVPPAILGVLLGRPHAPVPRDLLRRIFKFSGYAWASGLASALIWARPEMAFLKFYHGNEAVGLYAVGYTLASLAIQGPALLTKGLVPYFSENAGPDRHAEIVKMMHSGSRLLAFLILPICFVTAALVPQLVLLLFGSDFAEAVPSTTVLVASAALLGNMFILTGAIASRERNDFSFASNLAGAVLMLGSSLLLIPGYGIEGAAAARAVVQLFLFGVTIWFVTRRLGYQLPYSHLLRLTVAALASAMIARVIVIAYPNFAGMILGAGAAALSYLVLVRLLNAIPETDLQRLQAVIDKLPGRLQWLVLPVLVRILKR